MNSKRSSYRGFGIYLLLILAIIGIWYWMDGNTSTNSYTRAQFETAVADGNVAQLKIVPNRGEVPTGNVYITFKDSSTQVLAVNDVNDIEDYLRDQQFTSYTVENPPEQSWIVTILPYLIIFAAMFIFFMIMTNQAAANSGGGGKMMNFGKSRAKLMTDDPAKRVTFANVAGLKEEKEELEEIVDFLRPGRFDRKVHVGRPDVGGREEILFVHAKNKPLGDDVDLKQIAQTTAGFTGADLENLLNEAAIIAAKEDRAYITQTDIKKAFVKVGIGAEKKSRVISEKEKRITAFHESGHAILFHLLPDVGPVYSVSIIPTGAGAAGYTMPLPERDDMFNTKGKMLQDIIVSLGGRVAEELVFDDITTGASQDIKQATRMAKDMVTKYGMSENIGLICYDNDDDEVFIGRDLAHTRGYGEGVATTIDLEVKRIIDECYEKAKQMIAEHRDVLDACANLLLEKEKISQQEFEALFEQ